MLNCCNEFEICCNKKKHYYVSNNAFFLVLSHMICYTIVCQACEKGR